MTLKIINLHMVSVTRLGYGKELSHRQTTLMRLKSGRDAGWEVGQGTGRGRGGDAEDVEVPE